MPAIFEKIDRIKPFYDLTYKVVLFVCKVLLVIDIAITSMAVAGRYIPVSYTHLRKQLRPRRKPGNRLRPGRRLQKRKESCLTPRVVKRSRLSKK